MSVSYSPNVINPYLGEAVQIQYEINAPAQVTLRVFEEATDVLIYESTATHNAAGTYSRSWDGTDGAGKIVSDEAYYFQLVAANGASASTYAKKSACGTGSYPSYISPKTNVYANEYLEVIGNNSTCAARVSFWVQGAANVLPQTYIVNGEPYAAGEPYHFVWDLRDPAGNPYVGAFSWYVPVPAALKGNSIIVRGGRPRASGLYPPSIVIKSNPYHISHSYDQFSTIEYTLDQDAYVSIWLLPPGVTDPADPAAIPIKNNELQPALDASNNPVVHRVEWTGVQDTDPNAVQVSTEGLYTYWIKVTSVASGQSSVFRSSLQLAH